MSSNSGGSKKLAIINSQNTTRSLKVNNKRCGKTIKARTSEHQVEDTQLPVTAFPLIDSLFEANSDLDDLSDTTFPSQTNIRSHSRATSFVDSRALFCSNDSNESNQHHSASVPLMHGNTLNSPSRSSSRIKDEISVPAPLLSQHKTTMEYTKPVATPKSNVVGTINKESVAEFFALSKGPVTIDDFFIGGESLSLRPREGTPNLTTIMRPPLTNAVSPSFSTLPHTIHQFCVHTDLPLLPLQLQILSRIVHAHPTPGDLPRVKTNGDRQRQLEEKEHGLEVLGVTIPIENDPMKLLWAPAPGKLALYPSTVQRLLTTQRPVTSDVEDLHEIMQEEPVAMEILQQDNHLMEVKELQQRALLESTSELTQESESTLKDDESQGLEEGGIVEAATDDRNITTIDSYSQFLFVMNEVTWQREQLIQIHKNKVEAAKTYHQHEDRVADEDMTTSGGSQVSQLGSSSTFNSTRLMRKAVMRGTTKRGASTTGKVHRPIKRTKSAMARSQYLREEVSKLPRHLRRSVSFPSVLSDNLNNTDHIKQQLDYNPSQIKLRRTNTLPDIARFDTLFNVKGKSHNDPKQWAQSKWDEWFYEVLAEVRSAIVDLEKGRTPYFKWQPSSTHVPETFYEPLRKKGNASTAQSSKPKTKSSKKSQQQSTVELELLNIPLSTGTDVSGIVESIRDITMQLNTTDDSHAKATLLSERGALNRKIGKLCESLSDLSGSISLSSRIALPHWERHLISLVQGKEKSALEDLTLLLKKDHNHVLGYVSRGTLLAKIDRLSDAIQNYTRAIWLDNNNPKLYFVRAELKEKRGEVEAAVSDYATVVSLEPLNEEALMRQAMHKFNRRLWGITAQLLTQLLTINRSRMEAWLLRSQAYLNMGEHGSALRDLSAAIHLNPTNFKLFYQRGCLVRSKDPHRAVQDFSIALLIGNSETNKSALAYLHRGVVYSQLKSLDEALSDFKMAQKLDSSLASAHTNSGLILMNYKKSPSDAVKCFTTGILADPTYIRALLCRAEAYTQMKEYGKAVLDWTRAIHCSPDNPSYHLNRGKVFLKMKDYSNSLFCIKTASKLEGGVGSSPAQQALVYAFLGDHNRAISKLQAVVQKGRKNADLYTVLGKVQLRARTFDDAASSFTNAINHICFIDPQLYSLTHKKTVIELHYMCGRSSLGAGNFRTAVEEFLQVISFTPNNAWAHYYHGLALLKCGNSKGMVSINHALMLNPTLAEGFLTRAAFYGKVGRYSKAILNCTEAINLQPKSSRAHLYRGVLRHKMAYEESAIADLSVAIRLCPALSSVALFNRAICYQFIEETDKAIRDYSTICLMEETKGKDLYKVLINRGMLYLDVRDYRNALVDFNQVSEIQSDDPTLWQSIAFCHHKLNQLNDSVACYSKAISIDPLFIEAFIGRGNAHTEFLSTEGNQKARSDYNHVIKENPECLAAQLNLALLLQCEGKHMLAWENLTKLLEHHKDYVPALEARAIISLQNMNTFGSLLDINRAIQLEPSAKLYVERGVIYQYMKDVYNAVKDFDKAISIDPYLSIAHYNMGNILLQQKLYKQAVDRYSKAIELLDDKLGSCKDEALVNRGICYVAIGDDAKAFSDFDNAVRANPYAAHSYFNRANLFKRNGNLSAAEEDYSNALSLYPNDPISLDFHGYTLGLLGRAEESRMQFFKAVEVM